MKLASYKSTRPGIQGIANRLIRWRFDGKYSHTEVMFEPNDDVDFLMPDRSTQPLSDGSLWCASSVAIEILPDWSPIRAGKSGGVRFKRLTLDPHKWDVIPFPVDPITAATMFKQMQGKGYNWELCLKYIAFFMSENQSRVTCSQIAAMAGGFEDAWRFDPCTLHSSVKAMNATV